MASAKRDDLAKRLAERLDKAPAKGRAMSAPASEARITTDGPVRQGASTDRTARTRPLAPKPVAPKRTERTPRPTRRSVASAPGTEVQAPRPTRGATGTVLRGHLVPDSVHSEARRRKAALRSARGSLVTWDDVMREALALLIGRAPRVDVALDGVRRAGSATMRGRLVQATLTADLDQGLVDMFLDLSERPESAATYEHLWTTAILLWLDSTS